MPLHICKTKTKRVLVPPLVSTFSPLGRWEARTFPTAKQHGTSVLPQKRAAATGNEPRALVFCAFGELPVFCWLFGTDMVGFSFDFQFSHKWYPQQTHSPPPHPHTDRHPCPPMNPIHAVKRHLISASAATETSVAWLALRCHRMHGSSLYIPILVWNPTQGSRQIVWVRNYFGKCFEFCCCCCSLFFALVLAVKCRILQQFLTQCTYFTLLPVNTSSIAFNIPHMSRQHPQHHQQIVGLSIALPSYIACRLKSSRWVGGGAAAPAMMVEKVMISTIGVRFNLC